LQASERERLIGGIVTSLASGPDRPEDLVGTVIADRFDLLAFAGAGGMGHVYRARDRSTGGSAAIKLVSPANADVERFAREAVVLAAIHHDGVVRYLDHGVTADGAKYLAMEWLNGQDLSQRLGDQGTLGVAETLSVARCVADALAATHAVGIVHRDLKPANLFLVGDRLDAVKLLDFGIARAPLATEITATGVLVGTPAYMAPEQVRGDAIDPRVDVYALGAVIFRCLVGYSPFRGSQLAVLAKVLLESPAAVNSLRTDVPRELDALLTRLLSKEPADRPSDGAALAQELRALGDSGGTLSVRVPATISAHEQRVACVVLCAGAPTSEEETVREAGATGGTDAVRRSIVACGGVIDALARGAWVVTIPSAVSPAEEARRAARCALALAAMRPDAPLVVATGRVLVSGERRVGEVIDRAAEALLAARSAEGRGGVRLDAATAELLDPSFRLEGTGEWRQLIGEDETVAPVRTLLGRPAPCVGRDSQLATLAATLAVCEVEARACVVLVTAPPGIGKTRLVHEWLHRSVEPRQDVDLLFAQAEPIRAASPFGIAARILKRAAGILDSDSSATQGGKLAALVSRDCPRRELTGEMLAEICGTSIPQLDASPGLRAARADLSVMADAVREAWTEWMAARAARGTMVLLVEDLHWADSASVRLIEGALVALQDRPVFVLATTRPGGSSPFADRFREQGLVEVTLGPLSPVASERLVRQALDGRIDDSVVRSLAKRAGGHPFYLEELVRAVAGGHGTDALPDSVLGMVQARLDDLPAQSRRLLRAASVFGETCWSGGIAALLGDEVPEREARATLAHLARQEVLAEERSSKWSGQTEYRFRHSLLRDAVYTTLAEADRIRAHRSAATWLESMGETDPAVLAEHYDRGAASEQAIGFFRQAAAQALLRNDLDRAMSDVSRALALGPDPSTVAQLRAIEAEVLYWRGDLDQAAERASRAAQGLVLGAPEWFESVSVALGALGQLGRNDAVAALLDEAARVDSPTESRGPHVVALCRGMTQLVWAHHPGDLSTVRARLDALAERPDTLNPYESGWLHRARGEAAWVSDRDVGRCLEELEASCSAFERARAIRALCLTRLNAASLAGWSGDPSRGLALVASAETDSERLGAGFLLRYGRVVRALLLAYAGDAGAEESMRRGFAETNGPRLVFIAHIVIGSLSLERGDLDAAEAEAHAAQGLSVVDDLRPAAMALAARARTARGDLVQAERLAVEARNLESSCGDLELLNGMAGLALAEVHAARGDRAAVRAAIAPIVAQLSAIAATIPSAPLRRSFWQRPLPNDLVVRVATAAGIDVPS
jgi:tetratricopeptide (TPR) repeat protein